MKSLIDKQRELLNAGLNNKEGLTALQVASQASQIAIIELLIKYGVDINQVSKSRKTISDIPEIRLEELSEAMYNTVMSEPTPVEAALDIKEKVILVGGTTAWLEASNAGHGAVVDRLLQAGANVNQGRVIDGTTALMAASGSGHLSNSKKTLVIKCRD